MSQNASGRMQARKNWVLGALVVSFIAFAVAAFLKPMLGPVSMVIVLAVSILLLPLSAAWIVSLDEMARQAHYVAWYWGGTVGLCISALIMIGVAFVPEAATWPSWLADAADRRVFLYGIAAGLAPAGIGYLLCWAGYWLRHR